MKSDNNNIMIKYPFEFNRRHVMNILKIKISTQYLLTMIKECSYKMKIND